MPKVIGICLIIVGLILFLSYPPLPSGVIRNGFLVSLASLFFSWRLLRA
jgi:hypothetical protein